MRSRTLNQFISGTVISGGLYSFSMTFLILSFEIVSFKDSSVSNFLLFLEFLYLYTTFVIHLYCNL